MKSPRKADTRRCAGERCAESVIQRVIIDYEITDPHRQRRLVAQPIETPG
jgi:hypothetical protein